VVLGKDGYELEVVLDKDTADGIKGVIDEEEEEEY
jgi:hypothetical protein